ncbi:MAG TPA: aldo/keto reductase [Nannocystaceae bacterium]|nr:aldo/keto reductase [Nannocystaceae bacterium]
MQLDPAISDVRERQLNREYTARFPERRYRLLDERGLSSVGLGPCRERGDENPAAIVAAIALGCNVLDTAPHHHRGRHERSVGEAVALAVASGLCTRDALVVSTTVGRVPELVEQTIDSHGFGRLKLLVEEQFVARGLFSWHDLADGVHAIAPAYLRHSIAQSRERTGLARFDGVFLESPAVHRSCVSAREYQRRLLAAFAALEEACDRGDARWYGISASGPLDVAELVALAHTASASASRLRALRIPSSLLRRDTRAAIDAAADLGLFVFASGCLDGGAPQYQLPDELDVAIGGDCDAAAAIRWAESAPGVSTALFGSRDARHVRANLRAVALPRLASALYRTSEELQS